MSDSNEMYFDTDSFDFTSLDDVVVDSNELGYNTKQTGKDLMTNEEISDLISDEEIEDEEVDDLPPEDEDEVEESDEEESDEEEAEESEEDEEGEATVTDEDGEEVDFETYEVTLPNGETIVLSDAIKGYKDSQALAAEREGFTKLQEDFRAQSEHVGRYLELARLEADRVIEDYEDFDWAAYKQDDPVGYVENREFLDRYKARRQEIINAMDELETKKAAEEQAAFQEKAKEAGAILARDIPGWNNDLYQQLMMFAVENGANAEDIANSVDPAMFKLLYKAMQFEKGKQVVKAKVKKIGSPKKVVKPSGKPLTTKVNSAKSSILKKMSNGGLNERELSSAFDFLED